MNLNTVETFLKAKIQKIIFFSKWFLIPFYLKLMWTLINLCIEFYTKHEINVMPVLEAVDIVMVANLVKMIITGSYNSFIDKSHGILGEQVSSGELKVKMATSIVGVSSVHLLQSFMKISSTEYLTIIMQLAIHLTFILGAIAFARIDYLHKKGENHDVQKDISIKH